MNRFERGQAWLNKRFTKYAQKEIVYHRGSLFIPMVAWVGNTMFKILETNNQRMEWGDRDYLIPIEQLVIGGIMSVPQVEDWIEEVFPDPHGTQQFRIAAPESEPVWRYSDNQRTLYRVHTKRVTS